MGSVNLLVVPAHLSVLSFSFLSSLSLSTRRTLSSTELSSLSTRRVLSTVGWVFELKEQTSRSDVALKGIK